MSITRAEIRGKDIFYRTFNRKRAGKKCIQTVRTELKNILKLWISAVVILPLLNQWFIEQLWSDFWQLQLKEKNISREKYLSWLNSQERESSSQKKAAEDLSILPNATSPEERHPPLLKLGIWSEMMRGSPMWIRTGNMLSLTYRFGLDPPSLDISNPSSLTSIVALGVCHVSRNNFWYKTEEKGGNDKWVKYKLISQIQKEWCFKNLQVYFQHHLF